MKHRTIHLLPPGDPRKSKIKLAICSDGALARTPHPALGQRLRLRWSCQSVEQTPRIPLGPRKVCKRVLKSVTGHSEEPVFS